MPPLKLQLSTLAERDIEDILAHSQAEFGESARLLYEALLDAALRTLLANPKRPGVRSREELGPGICSYHLRFARDRVRRGRVRTPRHFLIFKVVASVTLQVGRILHDAMELAAHPPPDSFPPLNER